jgi:hypothetical protein
MQCQRIHAANSHKLHDLRGRPHSRNAAMRTPTLDKNNQPQHWAYELVDPHHEPVVPRVVSFAKDLGDGRRVWWARWELRELDGSRVGEWFRSLDAEGLLPREDYRFLPRRPLKWRIAQSVAAARIRMVCRLAGTYPNAPPWFLSPMQPHLTAKGGYCGLGEHRRAVCRVAADGSLVRYGSVSAAIKATGIDSISQLLREGHRDRDLCRWVQSRDN